MTTEESFDPRKRFVPRFLPWLLALVALAGYWFTLNRWVSLYPDSESGTFRCSLISVAKLSGWTWQPELVNPVFLVVTYPFRCLPALQIPLALNIFSAVCAALTLGLLARSVALLPHDRTEAQRRREHSDFSFLTIRSAWLPPVLAALVCGLQLTFWEHATNCTGEMFDLLLFAFVIWSLLEFRLDEREGRLFLAAAVYGAGMADNWAMVGFFPVFIGAIVWVRGLNFFNLRFLQRMVLCGLAGMLFYLWLPLLAVASGKVPVTFWQALKFNLSPQYNVLKVFFIQPDIRHKVELLSLTSLLPVFVLAIRWKSSFGDRSRIGAVLASFMFHLAHAVILIVCVWVVFDPPFSPRSLGFGLPCLTFYYLTALSVGYYSGYFLLVFGKEPGSRLLLPTLSPVQFLNPLILGGVWVLSILAGAGLLYKNLPRICATNDDTFQRYASLVEENLPRQGGLLLCDPDSSGIPRRLFLMEATLLRDGRAKDFLLLDTQSLNWPFYHRFLHNKFPQKWPEIVSAEQTNALNPLGLIGALNLLAKTNELYYLHPSFGYYFEYFYLEPHGLVYKLKTLPADTLLPPLPDRNQIASNEAFWSHAETQAFAPIERAAAPPDPNAPRSWGEKLLARLHAPREQNQNALVAGTFYSRGLNFWGVELQRAGDLTHAAARFTLAQKLNPDNVVAQINLQFNQSLRAGKTVPVNLSQMATDQFGKFHTWNEVLGENGPFDEPSFCFEDGLMLATQGGLPRQAIAAFARVRSLAPDNLPARLWLGQIYVLSHLPDCALEALRDPLNEPERFSLTKANSTELNVLAAGAYLQKGDLVHGTQLLETEIARHPTDNNLLMAAVQAYLLHGLFTNALAVIELKLRLTPDDPSWLFSRGYTCFQMKAYDDAIVTLTRLLRLQTNNDTVRFYRAVACLNSGRLDEARADYAMLQRSFTNSFQVAYGLGEIAWRKHETSEAIKQYKLYLANANTNTAEAKTISQRLIELRGESY
jgi:tetratricopeptide (TPR) repeat protein